MCYPCDADWDGWNETPDNLTNITELGRIPILKENSLKDKPTKVKTWTTRDGYVLRIKDMATAHIFNCLGLLNRKSLKDRPEYSALIKELFKRGELELPK